jgi:hypothetical protein
MSTPTKRPAIDGVTARIPDFFIVGHPKCGTTALYEMLRRHPGIHMPVKEPWFFVPERTRAMPGQPSPTFEDYVSLFAEAEPGQRVGEATPSYLRSPTAAGRIADVQPDARIIAILREPAAFLRSFHLQAVEAHNETETNQRKALALEQSRREGRAIPNDAVRPEDLLYSDHVRYVEQLRRYHAAFPSEQVLVLIYEDFRRDNEATVRRVLRFLRVDDSLEIEEVKANPTIRLRSRKLDDLMDSLAHGRGTTSGAVKAAIKTLTPVQLRRNALRLVKRRAVWGDPHPPDEDLMLELRRRFEGEVVALSDYLGRDLVKFWGYDSIG